ncbi:MAG: hypothetical protein JXD19_08830 [Deltaproteobacteria bacterium]|nr:hypothetical protein [Deltaproteobacteria bacterium]
MALSKICVLVLILLIAGCGKSPEEKAIEKSIEESTGGKADVDISKKGITISGETEEGTYTVTSGEGTEIPKDFPADVFIYHPCKIMSAVNLPGGHSLALATKDDGSTVTEKYKKEMTAKGWSEQTSMNMGGQTMLVYEKEGRGATISIAPADGGETQISMTVTSN